VTKELEVEIEAWFSQPASEVFEAWSDPKQLAVWFAAGDWQVTHVAFEPVAGARWRIDFRHPSGDEYHEAGVVLSVVPHELLEFTLTQVGLAFEAFETRVTVVFEAAHGGTRVRFRQVGFRDDAIRDGNTAGWESCFAKLRELLG
jgi:uncharacterized protein YndB with AHSA1/START domain